jgi:hypothetical protein
VRIDTSAAVARRVQTQRRRRALSAAARLAERQREKEAETPLERMYSVEALALAIYGSTAKVLRLVRKGALPPPCRIGDGEPFWRSVVIEPALMKLGYRPSGVDRDASQPHCVRHEHPRKSPRLCQSASTKKWRKDGQNLNN